jgi:FAD/FMN-containing dehydrogenase
MYVASATGLLLPHVRSTPPPPFLIVNLRFDITPAAIVFPSSASEVSGAVKAGVACQLPVVARSGGVRIFLVVHFAV